MIFKENYHTFPLSILACIEKLASIQFYEPKQSFEINLNKNSCIWLM